MTSFIEFIMSRFSEK